MYRFKNLSALLIGFGLMLAGAGCGEGTGKTAAPTATDDHDHDHGHGHEHADSYAGVLAELSELQSVVQKAFTDGDPDSAHDALHEVGHVLELTVAMAQKEGSSKERLEEVTVAVESLFEAYGAIDKGMHGGEKMAWSDVSADVETAMAVLKEGVEDGHGHDEHEGHDESHKDHGDHEQDEESGDQQEEESAEETAEPGEETAE